MTIEHLNYYQKIGDVASQILDIKEKARSGKKVSMLGLPDWFTPDDLLELQFERIRVLEVATKCTEDEILHWMEAIEKRKPKSKKEQVWSHSELNLLSLGIIKDNDKSNN